MLEPWNDQSILPPPVNTTSCHINFSIKELKTSCNSIVNVLSKQSPLHNESAILSRFLYKFDKKFRNDIGYRKFKKVNTALRRYLSVTLAKDVQNFVDMLPANNEPEPYLPTRQMLQYTMVRLITFSKIMYRITVCSKQAAIFYLNRIKQGESHWMCLMPFALLCRIWSMVLVLLKHSCNWYNKLYSFLKYLPYMGVSFLPQHYELPLDLEEWIDYKNLNQKGRFEWAQKISINTESIIGEDEEGDLSRNILKYVNDINMKTGNLGDDDEPEIQMLVPKHEIQLNNLSTNSNDEGVAISRESFQNMSLLPSVNIPSNENMVIKHSIENAIDKDTLVEFIEKEEEFRNKFNDLSLTSHLSFMQWQALRKALIKLNIEKLKKKLPKIWQEKCLDYLLE